MTAPHITCPAGLLGDALSQAPPDLMRSLLQHMIIALLSADADAACGAQWGQQDPQRHAQRNGYRHRPLDTRVGTIDVAIPKLRSGTYFPEWLLQRRKRAVRDWLNRASKEQDGQDNQYLYRRCQSYILDIL